MVVVAYITCAVVWGTTWFAIRHTIGEGGFATIPSAALRFSIAALVLLGIWLLGFSRPTPGRKHLPWLLLAGVLNGVGYACVYKAEETLPGGLAAVLFGTYPLVTALLATITRTEAVERHQLIGAFIALFGIALVFSDRLSVSSTQAIGVALLLVSVTCAASYGVVLKRHAGSINALATAAVFLAVTAVFLWAVAPLFGPTSVPWPLPTKPTFALLYLAIFGSVVAFASYFYLLRRVTLMTTTTLVFAQPVIAVGVDAAFERDAVLAPTSYIGMAIVLVGVLASIAGTHLRLRSPPEADSR